MHGLAVATRLQPFPDHGLGLALAIDVCGINGGKALIDEGVEHGKSGLLVHRPAEDIAPEHQGFDDEFTASERAAIHDASPVG
ncbi:hypothetical protein D3C84_1166040 [compost metagenome]